MLYQLHGVRDQGAGTEKMLHKHLWSEWGGGRGGSEQRLDRVHLRRTQLRAGVGLWEQGAGSHCSGWDV